MWKWVMAVCLAAQMVWGAEGKRLRVVTTILPVYCFASGVIGKDGEVTNLLPPNVGPHDYQLTPGDLRKLKEADLIIFNGLGIDGWISKAAGGARVLELGKGFRGELIESGVDLDLTGDHKHGHDHQHGPANPHIWLDPRLAMSCVSNILAMVQKLDPAGAEKYARNAEAYLERLRKLDGELEGMLAPVKSRPLITQHDAFPYLVKRYGLTQVGVVETTAEVQPSPRYLADLMKVIREKKAPVIFYDPASSSRLVKRIANDAKIRTAELQTLESGVARPGAYEEGMRRNAETLRRELGR